MAGVFDHAALREQPVQGATWYTRCREPAAKRVEKPSIESPSCHGTGHGELGHHMVRGLQIEIEVAKLSPRAGLAFMQQVGASGFSGVRLCCDQAWKGAS